MTAALAEEAWNVVLCAHRMPAFDALTALAVLGAGGVDVPLMIVSGESGEETTVAPIRAGAAGFVSLDQAQGYVIGHPAPIAGLLEDCQPWPT